MSGQEGRSDMMRLYQTYEKAEQENILTTFKIGHTTCKAALLTLLHALITFLLVIIHIVTFIINFSIGVLMISHAVLCMIRLLLVQCQDLTENPMNTIDRRDK
jgi:uncharacterized membrane protein YcgQ (UPF0703/DUF1980 family)